jgi:hypothetical protein
MIGLMGSVSRTLTVAVAAVLVLGVLASAQDGKVATEIKAVYARRAKAILEKDFALLKADETEDYSEKSKDGSMQNRKQADDEADELFKMVRVVSSYSLNVESINEDLKNGEATVETTDNGRLTFLGPDEKLHELFGKSRSRDMWKKTPIGWRLKFHEEIESTVEVDGKPLN